MKIFSIGFILAFIISSLIQHINITTIKEFFESMIVILPSTLLLIFICWQVVNFINEKLKYKKQFCLLSKHWQCLLIDGTWGSGKTTHYETYYKYIDDKSNIYISCFSASRSELIAQIIQQQFCWKLLTLNGLLAKFMESNWQIFMPKNRVVVFDDLERLHANQDNYLDLIGIIDYLKDKMECKIILICNMSELKESEKQKQHIFNTYMERIVDNVESASELSDLSKLFKNPKDKHHYKHVDLNSPIIQKIISSCYDPSRTIEEIISGRSNLYGNKLKNLRVFKTSISDFASKLNRQYLNAKEWDETRQIIYAETFVEYLRKIIALRYLFFADYSFFNKALEYVENKTSENAKIEIEKKLKEDLINLNLKIEDFSTDNRDELLNVKFEEYKIAQFIFLDFNKFTKCILDSKLDIFILYEKLCNKYENRDKYISTKYTDCGSKSTIDKLNNYQRDITRLDELRNYILGTDKFVIPLLQDVAKWLPDYATYNHNFAYYDEHINIYFALAMLMHKFGLSKEKTYIINKINFAYHTQKKHIRNYNYEFSKKKLKIFEIVRKKHLFWYLDSNSTLKSIVNQLKSDFKIILTEVEQQNDRKI